MQRVGNVTLQIECNCGNTNTVTFSDEEWGHNFWLTSGEGHPQPTPVVYVVCPSCHRSEDVSLY